MENIIKLSKNVTDGFKPRDLEQLEKFFASLSLADPVSLDILKRYKIDLTRCSQLIVLTQDPKELLQSLELAQKMGFINAYHENPRRLCQGVTNVIRRMSKCDAVGVPYKDAEGHFADFIFSERAFNKQMSSLNIEEKKIIELADSNTMNEESVSNEVDLNKVKEYAIRVLEQFAITEQQDAIFKRLEEIQGNGLSVKEMLMEAFKICSGNSELLSDTIDELLNQEESLGRVA